jgi:hypothetical protein
LPPERSSCWSARTRRRKQAPGKRTKSLSDVAAGDVRDILKYFGERTVPAIWWPEVPGEESLPPA